MLKLQLFCHIEATEIEILVAQLNSGFRDSYELWDVFSSVQVHASSFNTSTDHPLDIKNEDSTPDFVA